MRILSLMLVSGIPGALGALVPLPGTAGRTIATRFEVPAGFVRADAARVTFAHFLRSLPLLPEGAPVRLYDGTLKGRQDVHAAVLDLSVGARDLQQCADAVIRLRAEHLYANGRQDEIAFRFTNGFLVPWKRWRNGERVRVKGNACTWYAGAIPDSSHAALLDYLGTVFLYAGTLSLERELVPAAGPVEPGDVFIRGGSPGHAMLVVDVAVHPDGRRAFLLVQSYMPAQQVHVVRSPGKAEGTPWYLEGPDEVLRTPEWTFLPGQRRRWARP